MVEEVGDLESSLIRGSAKSSGQPGSLRSRRDWVSGGDWRAVAAQAGWTRLRRCSGWPARMRSKAIASMIVIGMVTRTRILASPRMPGRSNPNPA